MNEYTNFRFHLFWNGRTVAGVTKVIAPAMEREPISLERGVTYDREFHDWCRSGSRAPKFDVAIQLFNEQGQVVMTLNARQSRPSHYIAIEPEFPIAFERLMLDHDGVVESAERS